MRRKNFFSSQAYVFAQGFGLNGLVDLNNLPARIIAEDSAFLRSYAVFEVMEARGAVIFYEDEHYARLCDSMNSLRRRPFSSKIGSLSIDFRKFLKQAVKEVLIANNLKAARIEIRVTGGSTYDGYHVGTPANVFIFASPFVYPRYKSNGLKLRAVEYLREFPEVKTMNYCAGLVAGFWVKSLGFHEALYVRNGNVLECPVASFFIAEEKSDRIILKTAKDNTLKGITREIVLDLAGKMGIETQQCDISVQDVQDAQEAFICSTSRFVWPVRVVSFGNLGTRIFAYDKIGLGLRKTFMDYRRDYYKEHR